MPETDTKRRDTPGEVPAIQAVDERDDHFIVTDSTGTFRVEKAGLESDTLAHIQGMAHGGLVIAGGRVDPGGANDEGGATRGPEVGPPPHFPRMSRPAVTPSEQNAESVPLDARDERTQGETASSRGEELPQFMADGGVAGDAGAGPFVPLTFGAPAPIDWLMPNAPGPSSFVPAEGGGFAPAADAGSVALTPAEMALPPVAQRRTVLEDEATRLAEWKKRNPGEAMPGPGLRDMRAADVLAPRPQAPAQQPPVQPPSGSPQLPSGGGSLAEFDKGIAEQRAALQAQAEVEKARDASLLELQDRHIAQMQAMEAEHAEKYAQVQRRADDLFQATLSARIDPNRVWANVDVGQKIAAGIGILLSGIGSGMGGGPNLALQVVDRIIDRDVDAQKANLENQRSLLSHYLQQGHSMMEAHQLAKSDLRDMLAAQLTRVSAQFGGAEAAARAQMVGGQLRTEAAGKRQEIMARGFQMAVQRQAMAAEMERNRVMSLYARPPGGGPPDLDALLELPGMEKMRERRVRLPGGGSTFAGNKEQGDKATEALRVADELKRGLQRYSALRQNGNPRVPAWMGGDSGTAEQIYGTLTAKLKDLEKLGAISKGDYELIERQIPDISSWTTSGATMDQKLQALGAAIDDAVGSQLKMLGVGR